MASLTTGLASLDIVQVSQLVQSAGHYCIGLDVEGVEGIAAGVTSIGLAILPPLPALFAQEPDAVYRQYHDNARRQIDLDEIVAQHGISAHCFALQGRIRARSYEKFHYGSVTHIHVSEIEPTVIAVVESIRVRDPDSTFILVGFDMDLEFRAISSMFPSLSRYVIAYTDVAGMAGRLADARFSFHKASLRDTMLALGFCRNHSIQPRAGHHSAGMDAVRTLGILIALIRRHASSLSEPLLIHRFTMEEHANRTLWEKLPRPASKFPHTVKLYPVGGTPLPDSLSKPARLFNYITRNFGLPKAVAVCPPATSREHKTHGWVSFHDAVTMDRFVSIWDGREAEGVILSVGDRPPPEVVKQTSTGDRTHTLTSPSPEPDVLREALFEDALLDGGIGLLFQSEPEAVPTCIRFSCCKPALNNTLTAAAPPTSLHVPRICSPACSSSNTPQSSSDLSLPQWIMNRLMSSDMYLVAAKWRIALARIAASTLIFLAISTALLLFLPLFSSLTIWVKRPISIPMVRTAVVVSCFFISIEFLAWVCNVHLHRPRRVESWSLTGSQAVEQTP